MTIQFGGLATGLDTGNIVEQLMALERQPITRLETDKTWLNNRLTAFTELDTKLKSFADSIKNLGDADTLLQRSVKQSSEDFLSATVSSDAQAGTSYQVEVVSLAQVQKSVSARGCQPDRHRLRHRHLEPDGGRHKSQSLRSPRRQLARRDHEGDQRCRSRRFRRDHQ